MESKGKGRRTPTKGNYAGCLLGGCLGGSPRGECEAFVSEDLLKALKGCAEEDFLPLRRRAEAKNLQFAQYSDDSQLSRELAISIVNKGGIFDVVDYSIRIAELVKTGGIMGCGFATSRAAAKLNRGVPWDKAGDKPGSAGNGPATRAAPLGLLFCDYTPSPLLESGQHSEEEKETEGECEQGTGKEKEKERKKRRKAKGGPREEGEEAEGVKWLMKAATEQAFITHQDRRCAAGAIAMVGMVYICLQCHPIDDPDDAIERIASWIDTDNPEFAKTFRNLKKWRKMKPIKAGKALRKELATKKTLAFNKMDKKTREKESLKETKGAAMNYDDGAGEGISGFVTASVCWAVYSFLRSMDDYIECIVIAISGGGDTDSTAAMAGTISGAYLGEDSLPELVKHVQDQGKWKYQDLVDLGYSLYKCHHESSDS